MLSLLRVDSRHVLYVNRFRKYTTFYRSIMYYSVRHKVKRRFAGVLHGKKRNVRWIWTFQFCVPVKDMYFHCYLHLRRENKLYSECIRQILLSTATSSCFTTTQNFANLQSYYHIVAYFAKWWVVHHGNFVLYLKYIQDIILRSHSLRLL